MLWRSRSAQVRSKLAPPGFIQPSRPTLSKKPPTGELWVQEVKHDGYRLQVHVRAGRVRLYTMNAADWTERYRAFVKRRHGSDKTLCSAMTAFATSWPRE
jgi:ATP-dependent DNA ligase